ncbi:hypothetical protein X947_5877 [Burkholderia pseudomallei MSHR7334]|nr:hypothetical protein X947_5877 [Burkholderia pseudomallei MSHR7334]
MGIVAAPGNAARSQVKSHRVMSGRITRHPATSRSIKPHHAARGPAWLRGIGTKPGNASMRASHARRFGYRSSDTPPSGACAIYAYAATSAIVGCSPVAKRLPASSGSITSNSRRAIPIAPA